MLTVYRASAGSGKTHLLTGTYLNLLFSEGTLFNNILAVTFTNKATEEMKARIITELNLLYTDTINSDYYKDLSATFSMSEEQVRKKAGAILIEILHDYSNFNVSTIDKFFQQTIRAFTREIGLQSGYQIELDTTSVRIAAIDNMIADLELKENKHILNWLIDFAQEKMESQKDWNPRRELINLSLEIEKEQYKNNSAKIREFTSEYENIYKFIKEMRSITDDFTDNLAQIAKDALLIIENNGLRCSDFAYGKSSPFNKFIDYNNKIVEYPSKRFIDFSADPKKWSAKSASKELKAAIDTAATAGLQRKMTEIVSLFENFFKLYASAKASIGNIYAFAILSSIDNYIRRYARENNIMLISDTTDLLNRIIDGKDTPFVYEKIGTRLQHFMIDEFQDTSGMQWENFKPLIDDSMAHGFGNLIVGDVKQSIYRWRNSDWNLLHSKLRDYHTGEREDCVLDTNWRSCKNIVDFNNAFFLQASIVLQDKYNKTLDDAGVEGWKDMPYASTIIKAYEDTYQHVPEKKADQAGHVRIEYIESKNNDEYSEIACEKTKDALINLRDAGYELKDIAILVRTKSEGVLIADYLLSLKNDPELKDYNFDVISNEALIIANAPVVEMAVSMLRYIYNSDSKLNEMSVGLNLIYNETKTLNPNEDDSLSMQKAITSWFGKNADAVKLFEQEVLDRVSELKKNNLFDMVEKILSRIIRKDDKSDLIFAQAFQDLIIDAVNSGTSDLSAFLKWWDERGCTKTIATPDTQNAIRIMTVHKSKGLGFRAVIIPFASWSIDHDKPNIIWCEPSMPPFDSVPLVPVTYNTELASTIYLDDYMSEKRQAFIDNLNLAYVAFTRAKDEMIIFAKTPAKSGGINNISHLLYTVTSSDVRPQINTEPGERKKELICMSDYFIENEMMFEMGDWWPSKNKKTTADNSFSINEFHSIDPGDRLQLRLHAKGYFHDKEARLYGNMMHDVLSAIKIPEDITPAVNNLISTGAINSEEGKDMIDKLEEITSRDDAAHWFAPGNNVINETEILVTEGLFLRPDRVVIYDDHVDVIDYKFGSLEHKKYRKQVATYVKLMADMGYKNINGYLWYVELDKIDKI